MVRVLNIPVEDWSDFFRYILYNQSLPLNFSSLFLFVSLSFVYFQMQMSDDNPYVIPEMDPTLRKQIQECNWQIVNVTTPANYFHVLRRQVKVSIRSL